MLIAALAPGALAQTRDPQDSAQANQKGVEVIHVGATGEANGAPFGPFPNQERYRQYYSPAGFNFAKPLKISAVAFTSDPGSGTGTLVMNLTVSLGIARTMVPPANLDLPLENLQVCFNGPISVPLTGLPDTMRFPCLRDYHYKPHKGEVLVVDIRIHQRVEGFLAGFLFGFSPNVTRVYQNAADAVVIVEPGQGLYTAFEVK